MFVIVLYEGLLGGACYVNAFYRISQEVISSLIVLCSVYASLCVHGILSVTRHYDYIKCYRHSRVRISVMKLNGHALIQVTQARKWASLSHTLVVRDSRNIRICVGETVIFYSFKPMKYQRICGMKINLRRFRCVFDWFPWRFYTDLWQFRWFLASLLCGISVYRTDRSGLSVMSTVHQHIMFALHSKTAHSYVVTLARRLCTVLESTEECSWEV